MKEMETGEGARERELRVVEQFLDVIWPKWRQNPEMGETPRRILDGWREMLSGDGPYDDWTLFDTTYTGIVARVGIPVEAVCAHHLLSYTGFVDFAYIPNLNHPQKLGISKIVRYVRHRCRVPSSQEELTQALVKEFDEKLSPTGIILRFSAHHLCEEVRGVHVPGIGTVTEVVVGNFKEDPKIRQEALELFRAGDGK